MGTSIHQVLIVPLRLIKYLLSPQFWRWLLFRQMKVRVYLSSGQHVDVRCTKVKANLNGNTKSYSFEGLTDFVTFDAGEIVAVQER